MTEPWQVFIALALTRGFGQSSLSVVAITLVAKWFPGRRLAVASALFAVMAAPMYLLYVQGISYALLTRHADWRTAWAGVGYVLSCILAPLAFIFTRSELSGDQGEQTTPVSVEVLEGATLGEALRTPAFWVFALTTSYYGMIFAGIGLFNEVIFKECGLDVKIYHDALKVTALVAVVSKLVSGWLAMYWRITRMLACCLFLMGLGLLGLPLLREEWQVYIYVLVVGIAAGMVTLIFFAVWGQLFGRREVGRIQGIAQMITVLTSACGPLLFELYHRAVGDYLSLFWWISPIAFGMAVVGWFVPLPRFVGRASA